MAIFFPMKHLTLVYRRALVLVISTNWLFSLAMGAWQGRVHHAGPSTRSASCHVTSDDPVCQV